ncbi:hypothetical protein TNCV_2812861 [Trichonephila clavipes]|nr:hypothetical protein TNCV_2812861 [Trichonephila clavipes]
MSPPTTESTREAVCRSSGKNQARRLPEVHPEYSTTASRRGSNGKMRVENHNHICHIMLYHLEKRWKAAQSFRDLNEIFGKGTTTAKVSVGSGLPVSNHMIPAWRISQEEVGHRILTIRLFWQPWKRTRA